MNIDVDELRTLLQKLEFRTLLNNLPENMQAKTPTEDYVGGVKLTLPKNVLIDSNEKLKELKLPKSEQLFVHSRSAGKNGQNPQVLILSADGKTSYTLDLTKLDLKKVRDFLTTNYQLPTTKLVGHDVKSTLKLLKSLGCEKLPEVGHDVPSRRVFN